MPVSPTPPEASHRRATRAREHFLELRRDHELLGQCPPELFDAKFLLSLPVYALPLGKRRLTSLTHAARRVGWLHFLRHDSQVAAIEVSIEDGRHRHARFLQGELMGTLLDLVKKVGRRRGAHVRHAHMVLLRIHALQLSCVWLRGETDAVIPVNALAAHLEAGVEYSPEKFLAHVNDAAKRVLALPAEPSQQRHPSGQGRVRH